MTIELNLKKDQFGNLVSGTVKIKEKSVKELNDWYDLEEARERHEKKIQDAICPLCGSDNTKANLGGTRSCLDCTTPYEVDN